MPVITQGNRNLKPEKSKSFNIGAVFSHGPGRLRSFSIEADYHDIKVKNAISGLDPNLTLIIVRSVASSCALVMRTAKGFVNEINATLQNLASIHVREIDVQSHLPHAATSDRPLRADLERLLAAEISDRPESTGTTLIINRRGTERGSPDQAYPMFKGNTTLDWTIGDFSASVTGRYIALGARDRPVHL